MSRSKHHPTDLNSDTDREGRPDQRMPRAIIHKQILDAAASQPDATMASIAEEVTGATTSLVEKVLGEYGDPAEEMKEVETTDQLETEMDSPSSKTVTNQTEDADGPKQESDNHVDPESPVDPEHLTTKQLKTLRSIYDYPQATQSQLAELHGVSSPTICQRVNGIEGFDWSDRYAFAKAVVERTEPATDYSDAETDPSSESDGDASSLEDVTSRLSLHSDRIASLERRLPERTNESSSVFSDLDLARRTAHACMNSDLIEEDEELAILEEIIERSSRADGH